MSPDSFKFPVGVKVARLRTPISGWGWSSDGCSRGRMLPKQDYPALFASLKFWNMSSSFLKVLKWAGEDFSFVLGWIRCLRGHHIPRKWLMPNHLVPLLILLVPLLICESLHRDWTLRKKKSRPGGKVRPRWLGPSEDDLRLVLSRSAGIKDKTWKVLFSWWCTLHGSPI